MIASVVPASTARTTLNAAVVPSLQAAQAWAEMDPNPTTQKYTLELISEALDGDGESFEELESIFPESDLRIGFGTAGLRSEMKPGPLGMNDLTVCQTAQGLAKYCLKQQQQQGSKTIPSSKITTKDGGQQSKRLCAVVGYDHRSHPTLNISSLSFAILTALVFAEAGIDCILLNSAGGTSNTCGGGVNTGFVHTPLVPFAIQQLGAVCGIMITASHNPSKDNGYKVYDMISATATTTTTTTTNHDISGNCNGYACQIRSPTDRAIAAEILENLKPWKDYGKIIEERRKEFPNDPCLGLADPEATKELLDEYYSMVIRRCSAMKDDNTANENGSRQPSFVYTAMHGVGWPFAKRAFECLELQPFETVIDQKDPDPSFPTVPFPNPEEKGALELAKKHAEDIGADIVLANDPDADRLGVAERDQSTGIWTIFTGDQIGTMLGLWLWETIGKNSNKPVSMCTSTVSSKMLAEIGKREGFLVEETLSGFKWIGSRGVELQAEGYHHLFGYEEAIGFACGNAIFDKDGVSAMVVLAELAVRLYSQDTTLKDHIDHLYTKYGFFCSRNGYFVMPSATRAAVTTAILNHLRSGGTYEAVRASLRQLSSPSSGGERDLSLLSIRDLGYPGYDSTRPPDFRPVLNVSKAAPLLTLHVSIQKPGNSSSTCVIQLRPSGTEPKFKYYLEMQGSPGISEETIREDLRFVEEMVLDKLLEPIKHGLTK